MSLLGAMQTSVSGMAAQSHRMSSVAENIANTSTTGYKRSSMEFETVLGETRVTTFSSGGVSGVARHGISDQGGLTRTSSGTDLAINGGGFFVVAKGDNQQRLTRAGSFVANGDGELVNTAGYSLLGYNLQPGGSTTTWSKVNISQAGLSATATDAGSIVANLPADAATVAGGQLPSTNAAGATYTAKTSLTTFDNLGHKVVLDVYLAKTSTGNWEATAYDSAAATAAGGFPYSSGPIATQALGFSPADGSLASPAGGIMSIAIPGGRTLALDLSKTTQLAAGFQVSQRNINGNAPSAMDHVEIAGNGTMSAVYQDGTRRDIYKIPVATVTSPDNLSVLDGNTYSESTSSGSVVIGTAGEGQRGSMASSTLEASDVDLGTELTTMIDAQRNYSFNSKVFQAGSDILNVLMNLKV